MVSPLEERLSKESIDAEDNIIISYPNLRNILPPKLKKVTAR